MTRARNGIAAVCAAEPARPRRVDHLGPANDAGQRQPGREALGHGSEIGFDARALEGEPLASPAEPALDLVDEQHDAVHRLSSTPPPRTSVVRPRRSRPREKTTTLLCEGPDEGVREGVFG